MTLVTDPLNVATTLTYDTAGNLLSRSRPLVGTSDHQFTSYTYGDSQHPGDVTVMTDPDNKTSSYGYDSYGDLTSSTDPLGNKTTYGYDTIGRKTSQVSPKGNVTGGTPADYTTSFVYNAVGDLTSITDPLGHQTQKVYDADRNLTSLTDANNHQTTYAYDADNELTTVTRPDTTTLGYGYDADGNRTSQTDGANHTTSYAFDPLNRQSSVTDPLNRTTSYGYDGAGNRTTLTDPANQVTTFGYNAGNELTSISYSDGTTPNVSYAYDADGRRTSMTDGTGTTSYSYDSLNRLTSSTNGASATVGYAYDLKGQLTTLTYPGSHAVTRGYDDAGRLTSVSDWLNDATTFAYDPNGNLFTEAYPNGIVASFGYNRADQNLTIEDDINQSPLFSLSYVRDNMGRLASTGSTGLPGASETYGYTSLSQLNAVNSGSYGYDTADNLTATPSTSALAYDATNQLTSLTNSSGTTTYSFDSRGNRISSTDPNQVVTPFTYDQANRLLGYGSSASYVYDGDGLRASKTVGGTTTSFTWDTSESLPLLMQAGATRYIYGVGEAPLEQIDGSSNVLYYHQDQIGSTRALSDSTGALPATFTFDAYGNLTGSTGSVSTPFGFTGQYTDAESGLQYLRARYYEPSTEQFLTRDPLAEQTGTPYAYVSGDPLDGSDPAGLCGLLSTFNPFSTNNCLFQWAYDHPTAGMAAAVASGSAAVILSGGTACVVGVCEAAAAATPLLAAKANDLIQSLSTWIQETCPFLADESGAISAGASTPWGNVVQDFESNPDSWNLVSVHAEEATARAYKGGISIEEVFGKGMDTLVRHTIYGPNGDLVYGPTYRPYAKFGG